jgi:hypothetical protein
VDVELVAQRESDASCAGSALPEERIPGWMGPVQVAKAGGNAIERRIRRTERSGGDWAHGTDRGMGEDDEKLMASMKEESDVQPLREPVRKIKLNQIKSKSCKIKQ